MGWAVGWDDDHNRHRGYGVPAYCDAWATGCRAEIDRGFGWLCEGSACDRDYGEDGEESAGCLDRDDLEITTFVCGEHTCADVDESNLPPEHPDWVKHVTTDPSWAKWREENPGRLAAMTTPARPAAPTDEGQTEGSQ